ncbi:MAG: M81 family metallopeptidase, partial [Chloroflexi bacterium]
MVARAAEHTLKPVTSVFDCRMIGVYHTSQEPVRSFVAHMQAHEGKNGVLSVSLAHGFPWGDVPDMGTKVLVVTDDQPENGTALARRLGEQFFAMRHRVQPHYETLDSALELAIASEAGPVVLADVADNAGGGAPNDSTFILRRLIERNVENAALGCIWDPVVVAI